MEVGPLKNPYKYSCKHPLCSNKYYSQDSVNKRFYTFPSKDPTIYRKWREFCSISEEVKISNFRLCEDHFKESDFWNASKARLKYGTIPSLPEPSNTQPSCSSCNILETERDFDYIEQEEARSQEVQSFDPLKNNISFCEDTSTAEENSDMLVTKKGVFSFGLPKIDLTPTKSAMYKIHRNVSSKISKLKLQLQHKRDQFKALKKLYNKGEFKVVEESLNDVTKDFIISQLRNEKRKPQGKCWMLKDKTFALSMYKRSPRLYRYLMHYFQLPSSQSLEQMLSKIPFEAGINDIIMKQLERQVASMNELDRYCVLMFDEVALSPGSHYADLGHLGRYKKLADQALVFMARGIRKNWKQVICYYLIEHTVSAPALKQFIIEIIEELQKIGLKVVATVSDQGPTNNRALKDLVEQDKSDPIPFLYWVNGKPICVIYDVPHLLKYTRNALLRCIIEFFVSKRAKYEHMKAAFELDQCERTFKHLPRLRPEHFDLKDSRQKSEVKVAAAQLSYSMAACIETFVSKGQLPAAAAHTAEFAHKIDSLFDSLNGSRFIVPEEKPLLGVLQDGSPHIEFWSGMLRELRNWKLIVENEAGANIDKDVTNQYSFIQGWQITIRSIMYIWSNLKKVGFNYLSLRSFNQDPLENLFCTVQQHASGNDNPTCHQFEAALKTSIINGLTSPIMNGICEADDCQPLDNLAHFLQSAAESNSSTGLLDIEEESVQN